MEQLVQAMENQVETAEPKVEKELGPVAKMLAKAKIRKAALKGRHQELEMKNYIKRLTKHYRRASKRIDTELRSLRRIIGKNDFALLKDICTVNNPEQKNDKNEVTQEASTFVNKKALMTEARHLIVLQREERMKNGLRKRSSGTSRERAAHNSMVRFLTSRNEEAAKENAVSK